MTTELNLETLVAWNEPKRVETKAGPRMLRKAEPTSAFWDAWRVGKESLKAAGISCGKDKRTGAFEALWWLPIDKAIVEQETAKIEESKQSFSDFQPPKPDGMEYLPFQRAGIGSIASRFAEGKSGMLLADEQGLGKTVQAIGTINCNAEINRILIICPNTLKLNWKRELGRWLTKPLKIGVQYAGCSYLGDNVDVLIINYDIVGKFPKLAESKWDLRICDESHYLKNAKAARTKAAYAIPARFNMALTGTPILNRPIELFTTLHDLDPEAWPKFFGFAKRYCDAVQNRWGWDFSGASNLEELQRKLRGSGLMVRRLKADVLTELPAKRRQVIEFEANGSANLIEEENREFEARKDRLSRLQAAVALAQVGDDESVYRTAVEALRDGQGALFEEMAKIRHEVALAKLPKCLEFVEDAVENGKVIVFCHHLDIAAALKEKFPQAAVITGETKADLRQGEVDRFQTDPACNVFVGNLAAAEGITLTAASHVIFVEGQWVPGKLAQMEDRAHRIGQKESVLVSYLVLEGSLDATMAKDCVSKLDVIDKALDKALALQEPVEIIKSVTITATEAKQAPEISPLLEGHILAGLKTISGMDNDHARDLNGIGFSKVDCYIGHSLAERTFLSPKQALLGLKLCRKYRRQLSADLVEALGVGAKDKE